mgnify:CR=1 FL=1
MSSHFVFKKGDLIGINEKDHLYAYLIAQVIRKNRFFYCLCLETNSFHFLVFDPSRHFLLCPEFNPDVEPDINVVAMGAEFYKVLDRLFDFTNDDDTSP